MQAEMQTRLSFRNKGNPASGILLRSHKPCQPRRASHRLLLRTFPTIRVCQHKVNQPITLQLVPPGATGTITGSNKSVRLFNVRARALVQVFEEVREDLKSGFVWWKRRDVASDVVRVGDACLWAEMELEPEIAC